MASEDGVDRRFPYRCSCGAAIEAAEARTICSNCGKTIEVLGTIQTPRGKKYKLRITSRRKHKTDEPPVAPTQTELRPHRRGLGAFERGKDVPMETGLGNRYNNHHFRLGLMILVFTATFTIFAITIGQDGFVKSTTRPPGDCDFYARPIGNKYCHYEGTPVRDPQDPSKTQIKWRRIND